MEAWPYNKDQFISRISKKRLGGKIKYQDGAKTKSDDKAWEKAYMQEQGKSGIPHEMLSEVELKEDRSPSVFDFGPLATGAVTSTANPFLPFSAWNIPIKAAGMFFRYGKNFLGFGKHAKFSKGLDEIVKTTKPTSTVKTTPKTKYTPEAELLKNIPNPKNVKTQVSPKEVHRTVVDKTKMPVHQQMSSDFTKYSGPPITTTKEAWETATQIQPGVFHHTAGNVGLSTSTRLKDIQNLFAYRGVGGTGQYSKKLGLTSPKFKGVKKWDISYDVTKKANILPFDLYKTLSSQSKAAFPNKPIGHTISKGQITPHYTKTVDWAGSPLNVPTTSKRFSEALKSRGWDAVRKWGDNPEIQWLDPKAIIKPKKITFNPNLKKGGKIKKKK
tara:strand:+ start:1974 stop:3128 length:1155 start_codon:yes stop_codon:yes gene_type:complete